MTQQAAPFTSHAMAQMRPRARHSIGCTDRCCQPLQWSAVSRSLESPSSVAMGSASERAEAWAASPAWAADAVSREMRASVPPRMPHATQGWQTPEKEKAPASLARSLPLVDRTNAMMASTAAASSTNVAPSASTVPATSAASAAAATVAAAVSVASSSSSIAAAEAPATQQQQPQPAAAAAAPAMSPQQQLRRVEEAACRLLEKVVSDCADTRARPDQVFAPIFHSVSVPGITGGDYLVQHLLRLGLARKEHLSEAVVLHAFLLIDRLLHAVSEKGFHLCTRNVHRVLLATTLISAKLLDDECYNNTYWASVGGVSLPHLNQLELEVVSLLDYNLLVTASALEAARSRLLDSSA